METAEGQKSQKTKSSREFSECETDQSLSLSINRSEHFQKHPIKCNQLRKQEATAVQ